jgi:mono/diheme cytochrome c family protein
LPDRQKRSPWLSLASMKNPACPRLRRPPRSRVSGLKSSAAAGLASWLLASAVALADGVPQFNRDIRPLLSNSCFQCHGPDEKKRDGGLRLDLREEAVAVSESGRAAIVPGRPEESELLRRVQAHDPDEVMPPPQAKRPPLTAANIATLRAWITAGGPYEGHWALQPIRGPPLPLSPTRRGRATASTILFWPASRPKASLPRPKPIRPRWRGGCRST